MKHFLQTIIIAVFALIFTACSTNAVDEVAGAENLEGSIYATLKQYEVDDTRTTHIFNGSAFVFGWKTSDKISFFPTFVSAEEAESQEISPKEEGGLRAYFGKSKDFGIIANKGYTAYYPYKDENSACKYNAIPVSYLQQVQNSNVKIYHYWKKDGSFTDEEYSKSEADASAHLGNFNYMTSGTATSDGTAGLTFDFKQLQGIVRFLITVPADLKFTRMDVVNNETEFTIEGTVDITGDGTITPTKSSHCMTLSFGDTGFNFTNRTTYREYFRPDNNNGIIVAYMMIAPVTLSTKSTLYLTAENGLSTKCFKASLTTKTIKAGKAYQWTVNESIEDPIILEATTVEEWQKATGYENENGKGTETW